MQQYGAYLLQLHFPHSQLPSCICRSQHCPQTMQSQSPMSKQKPASSQEGSKYNEVYGLCPDQVVSDTRWHKAGDLRATVTPFLANLTIGSDNFKWMLFGDDDTVFLIDNVLNLIPHLDPMVPYYMTDHLWYPQVTGKSLLDAM